jgi:hypothetical protein
MFGQFGIRTPVYYAFKAFNELAKHPKRVVCDVAAAGADATTVACAAINDDRSSAAILVSTFDAPAGRREIALAGLPWKGPSQVEALLVSDAHTLVPIAATTKPKGPGTIRIAVELPADSVCLVRCAPQDE